MLRADNSLETYGLNGLARMWLASCPSSVISSANPQNTVACFVDVS